MSDTRRFHILDIMTDEILSTTEPIEVDDSHGLLLGIEETAKAVAERWDDTHPNAFTYAVEVGDYERGESH